MNEKIEFRELQAGTELCGGKYIIEKMIGMGGFGITYYAKHATLQQYYAIKEFFINGYCIRDNSTRRVFVQGIDESEYEDYKKRFVDEAQTLADLDHSSIVSVIDIFDENGTSYMVMPFVKGITLQKMVEKQGKLPYDIAVNYMAQICEAVAYIHGKHLLHRDLTPDNIIVNAEDKVTIIDFGAARRFVEDKTQRHTAIVKKGYAPIEQYSATSRKGSYSDIYSLGAVLYFLLTGQKPMDATVRLMEKMPEPCELDKDIPQEANLTIMKAMSIKPEDRYQNANEMMDDLLGDLPATPIKKKVQKGNRKNRIAIILSLSVLTIGIGIGTGLKWMEKKKAIEIMEADLRQYQEWISHARTIAQEQDSINKACFYLESAAEIEDLYKGTPFEGSFDANARKDIPSLERKADSLFEYWKRMALDAYSEYQKGFESEKVFVLQYIGNAEKFKHDSKLEILKNTLSE